MDYKENRREKNPYLLNLLGEPNGPEPVEQRANVHEVDADEQGVPERGVEPAGYRPGPEREEGTAHEEGEPEVEGPVEAGTRRQMREQEEGVGQLEVDVVNVDALVRLASEGSVEKGWRH